MAVDSRPLTDSPTDSPTVRLEGGYHNDVVRRERAGVMVVEKQYSVPRHVNPMYPNLPEHEAFALQALAGSGCAPRFVDFRPAGPSTRAVLTYEFVAGSEWSRGVTDVARLLHTVHRWPVDCRFRQLLRTPADVLAAADSMVADVPAALSAELRGVRPMLDREDLASMAACESIVHTDCGPGNVVRGRDRLVLIDWQCPGRGDATEDVACFRSPAMMILYRKPVLSGRTARRFLGCYASLSDAGAETVERHARVGSAWHFRIGAYCVWRAHQLRRSAPDVAARYREALAAEIEYLRSGRP